MSFVRVCKLKRGKVILEWRLLRECNVKTWDIVRILMSQISATVVFFNSLFLLHFIDNNNSSKKKKYNRKKRGSTVLQFTSCNMSFVQLRLVLHITQNKRKLKNCRKKFSPSANKLVTDIKVLEKWAVKLVCRVTLDSWVIWLLRFARFFHDLAQKVLPEKN